MSLKNYLQASHRARINYKNIKAVFQAFFRKHCRNIGGFQLKDYMYEQIIWRRTQVISNSPKCWYTGNCKVCGCDILGKTMEDRACSISEHPELLEKRKPCYPAMMSEEEWKEYKKTTNIKLFN